MLPFAANWVGQAEDFDRVTVGSLIDDGELAVKPAQAGEEAEEELREIGFHYSLWLGDGARRHYDLEAVPVATVLGTQPGIGRVEQEDREVLNIKAPRLCPEGALAALAVSLLDHRVRESQ